MLIFMGEIVIAAQFSSPLVRYAGALRSWSSRANIFERALGYLERVPGALWLLQASRSVVEVIAPYFISAIKSGTGRHVIAL